MRGGRCCHRSTHGGEGCLALMSEWAGDEGDTSEGKGGDVPLKSTRRDRIWWALCCVVSVSQRLPALMHVRCVCVLNLSCA